MSIFSNQVHLVREVKLLRRLKQAAKVIRRKFKIKHLLKTVEEEGLGSLQLASKQLHTSHTTRNFKFFDTKIAAFFSLLYTLFLR